MYHGDEDEKGEIREDDRNNKDNKDEDDDDKDGRRTRVSMLNIKMCDGLGFAQSSAI
ncbi:uncharacterized protein CPUR_01859 [Claviceps purpurea 20.1]|uniref:Uncharacterized protein n=1 Tax=Claviceps purpurea (strain 20.1) TaxID=1111077 RepID=M1WBP7_CLAP2|nr:uncharacterized protein CPUR_01859 [Claviceps purpurea 20.1]